MEGRVEYTATKHLNTELKIVDICHERGFVYTDECFYSLRTLQVVSFVIPMSNISCILTCGYTDIIEVELS